jgi:hypothetical protein
MTAGNAKKKIGLFIHQKAQIPVTMIPHWVTLEGEEWLGFPEVELDGDQREDFGSLDKNRP